MATSVKNISWQNDTKYLHLTWPIVCRWRLQMYVTMPQYLNSLALFITIPNKVYKVYNTLRIICIQHYNDVIMSAVVSQITSVSIVCSTVGSGADQRKHQSSASLVGIHRSQKVCNAENYSIGWCHHESVGTNSCLVRCYTIQRIDNGFTFTQYLWLRNLEVISANCGLSSGLISSFSVSGGRSTTQVPPVIRIYIHI